MDKSRDVGRFLTTCRDPLPLTHPSASRDDAAGERCSALDEVRQGGGRSRARHTAHTAPHERLTNGNGACGASTPHCACLRVAARGRERLSARVEFGEGPSPGPLAAPFFFVQYTDSKRKASLFVRIHTTA